MASPESINEALLKSLDQLDLASKEIAILNAKDTLAMLVKIAQSAESIISVKSLLHESHPDLQHFELARYESSMHQYLSLDQKDSISGLANEDVTKIDDTLVACSSIKWQKLALVVGTAMSKCSGPKFDLVPDVYFLARICKLVNDGRLEYRGSLNTMGFCEIKRLEHQPG